MPRRYSRKSYSSRPGYGSCAKMVYGDAQKALTIARSVKRLLNVEIKNFDVTQTAIALGTSPDIVQLSNIPSGDTTNSRDGSQCKMVGLELNFHLQQNSSAIAATFIRLMVVLDKQTNQAIYDIADLLEDTSVNDIITSPRNLDNKNRFVILYDRIFVLSKGGTNGAVVRKYIKKEVLLRYDASTPSIADLTQNSLSFVQFNSEGTNVPSITFFSRLRFIDN